MTNGSIIKYKIGTTVGYNVCSTYNTGTTRDTSTYITRYVPEGYSDWNVVYTPEPSTEPSKPKIKTCEYCGSRCDDVRGNCGACGAPKSKG